MNSLLMLSCLFLFTLLVLSLLVSSLASTSLLPNACDREDVALESAGRAVALLA
jgi:hypothetical protein